MENSNPKPNEAHLQLLFESGAAPSLGMASSGLEPLVFAISGPFEALLRGWCVLGCASVLTKLCMPQKPYNLSLQNACAAQEERSPASQGDDQPNSCESSGN